jgi:hypothetical protein
MCLRLKFSWVNAYVQGKAGDPSGADGRKTPLYLNRELLVEGASPPWAYGLKNIH